MSIHPININDFTSDLSREVANVLDPIKRGDLIGRQVITILSNQNKLTGVSSETPYSELIAKVIESAFTSIQSQEVTFRDSTAFEDSCSSLSGEEIERRLEACNKILTYFSESKKNSGIYKKIAGILEAQKEHLQLLKASDKKIPGMGPPLEKESITDSHLAAELKRIDPSQLKEDINWLKDDFLETAKIIISKKESLEELKPGEKQLCFQLFSRKDEIESIAKQLSLISTTKDEEFEAIVSAVKILEDKPFIKHYQKFDQLKTRLENGIGNESSISVELYLKRLINNTETIHKVVSEHSPQKAMVKLSSEELKLCFYCIAKFQEDIQELSHFMNRYEISYPGISPEGLENLSLLASELSPLKEHFVEAETSVIPSEVENIPYSEALRLGQMGIKILLEKEKTPEMHTTALEDLFRSVLGLVQNDHLTEATMMLKEATHCTPIFSDHPLLKVAGRLDQNPQHGIQVSGLGTSYIKENTVHLTKCLVDGRPKLLMDFKLNGHGLLALSECIKGHNFQDRVEPEMLKEVLPSGFCTKVSVSFRDCHKYKDFESGGYDSTSKGYEMPQTRQLVIDFEGVGKVFIGDCPSIKAIHNMVFAEAELLSSIENTLQNIHIMLSAIGCPPVTVLSRKSDLQKKAMLHVFRSFYPREAVSLERNGKTYQLETRELYSLIIERKREVKELFEEHLDSELLPKYLTETYPGSSTTRVHLSQRMIQEGALGLMAGLSGSVESKASFISTLCSEISKPFSRGMISSQVRFNQGIIIVGESSYTDHKEGGAAGVFTRLITQELAESHGTDEFAFSGNIQILIDLEAVNRPNSYGYESDTYGSRSSPKYFSRLSLIELTRSLQRPTSKMFGKPVELKKFGTANEVVIRDSIGSQFLRGIVVKSEEDRRILIDQLIKDKVVEKRGEIWYLGSVPIEEFIHVSKKFAKEMWHD